MEPSLGCRRTAGPSTPLHFGRDDEFVWDLSIWQPTFVHPPTCLCSTLPTQDFTLDYFSLPADWAPDRLANIPDVMSDALF